MRKASLMVMMAALAACSGASSPDAGTSADAGSLSDAALGVDVAQGSMDGGAADALPAVDAGPEPDAGPHRCGDGRIRPDRHPQDNDYEECDDANTNNEDACSNGCRFQVRSMVALNQSTCALLANGQVFCRGYAADRTLGLGEGRTVRWVDGWRKPRGLGAVAQLDGGRDWICARHEEGTISCWGIGSYGRSPTGSPMDVPTSIRQIRSATDLAVGVYSACIIDDQARAACWGRNRGGALGDGTTENVSIMRSGYSSRIFEMRSVPIPEPVPPPRE